MIKRILTEEEMVIIGGVIKRLAPQFTFGYYDVEDIEQEAFIIAMAGLVKYEEHLPLENFMSVHIRNRLKNLKRDRFYRYEPPKDGENGEDWRRANEIKRNLMCPSDISQVNEEKLVDSREFLDSLAYSELMTNIKAKLSQELRADFMRMTDGVRLSKERKCAVQAAVQEIIDGA